MSSNLLRLLLALVVSAAAFACSDNPTSEKPTYSISGTVSGDVVADVTLSLSGAASATATTDATGNYSFGALENGSYTIKPSLEGYTFDPPSASVTLSGANVDGTHFVASAVTASTYSVGGTVSGLDVGDTLVLQNNGAGDVTVTENGEFAFATELASGDEYNVTVKNAPDGKTCSVSNGTGTIASADVSEIAVTCKAVVQTYKVGGMVFGLASGAVLVLQNKGTDDVTITGSMMPAIQYAFATKLASGDDYEVTVKNAPAGKTCVVSNGKGTISDQDVSANVVCS
jgi:hypothetical protein